MNKINDLVNLMLEISEDFKDEYNTREYAFKKSFDEVTLDVINWRNSIEKERMEK